MNDSEKTILEDTEKTLLEENNTVIENVIRLNQEISSFRGYKIIRQFSAFGSEADIYLVEKEQENFILKLYRYGISPKEEIISKIKMLSADFPEYFVKIYETGFDGEYNRWFEIQEFIKFSSLKEHQLTQKQLHLLIDKISGGLKILHDNNILHLDLKPANILVRSTEPFNPVFTDFGISSLLDPELTRKMTTIKGTPLYWAPESFTGVVGKEADYWSLGIIILEILAGSHPFSGMEQQVIMFTLSTRGVNIPEKIPDDFKLILRGLLTRNPRKRWGYEEVRKWLSGEKNIQAAFFEEASEKTEFQFPYEFKGEQYYSLKNLLARFISDEESWNEARQHFEKGYISRWLEKNDDFSKAIAADNLKENNHPDFGLAKLVYKFNPDLPFVWHGKYITLQNLYIYTGRTIKREALETEKIIVQDFTENNSPKGAPVFGNTKNNSPKGAPVFGNTKNNLLEYYDEYLKLTGKQTDDLYLFLDLVKKNNISSDIKKLYSCLNIIFEPEKYSLYRYSDLTALIVFVTEYLDYIIPKEELLELVNTYILPRDFIKALERDNISKYGEALKNIRYLKNNNYLIEKRELNKLFNNNILPGELKINLLNGDTSQYIVASGNIRHLLSNDLLIDNEELEFISSNYILPGYEVENLKSDSYEKYIEAITVLKEMQQNNLLIGKKELLKFESFVLPAELLENLKKNNLQLYRETAKNLRQLQEKNLFIKKSELEDLVKKYILPAKLKEQLQNNSYQRYLDIIKDLKYLTESGLLLEKKDINSLPAGQSKTILDSNISQYAQRVRFIKSNSEKEKKKKSRQKKEAVFYIVLIIVFLLITVFFAVSL